MKGVVRDTRHHVTKIREVLDDSRITFHESRLPPVMLETKFKIAFLVAVLFLCSLPIMGILQGTTPTPKEDVAGNSETGTGKAATASDSAAPIEERMVLIPLGPFTRGTMKGGYDERPEHLVHLGAYSIDQFEVTNHQYQQFVVATEHRKPAPPSRYAKNLGRLRGTNQPAVYVSWYDARAYCRWRNTRLPTEAEWEKAMRGMDGRLWPWGNVNDPGAANLARINDGYDVTAPVGSFNRDVSPFGVADGTGNVMEWVADWYEEKIYQARVEKDPRGPEHGVFKVLRGGGYRSSGSDVRVTSRSKMVPDFRDETIGFRCAVSGREAGGGDTRGKI